MKKFSKIAFVFLFSFGVFLGPVLPALAQNATSTDPTIDTSYSNNYEDRLQNCNVTSGQGFAACFVNLAFYVVLTPSGWLASVAGEIFDYFVQYSLDSNSYTGNGNFIERGWSILRDIGNVLFIFALLYIAISHILQAGTSGTKKLLASLIIAALMINFSLFFSRVIIDGGNILARAFYNNIEVQNDDNLQYKTISQGIVAHVNPQRILSTDIFNPKYDSNPANEGKISNGYAFTIIMMAAAVNIILAITFFSVALLFVGRVVGLWFLMIFSPLALASTAVPNSGKMFKGFSFSGWLDQILSLSFMAPVFLFFLFLLIMFLQVIFQTNVPIENQTTIQQLMGVGIPFILVIFILNKAKSVANTMAGEAGEAVKSVAGKIANFGLGAAGLVGGAALGVTAFAGRNIGGRMAAATLEQGKFQERVRLNNIRAIAYENRAKRAGISDREKREHLARASQARSAAARNAIAVKQLDRARKGTFDVRRSDLLQKKILGSSLAKNVIGKGGYVQQLAGEAFGDKSKLQFGLGKGKDMNRKKYEDEKEKKALETAKLYEYGSQGRSTLQMIGYAAEKGMSGQTELLEHINKYIKEIRDNKNMSQDEKSDQIALAEAWRDHANTATDDADMRQVRTGIEYRDAAGQLLASYVGTNKQGETIQGQQKQGYANVKEGDTIFNVEMGVRNAAETADKIRRGIKPETIEDQMKKWFNSNNPPPPTPPPPGP